MYQTPMNCVLKMMDFALKLMNMGDAKHLLGLVDAFDVAKDVDLIGELTEEEALESCAEMGIAVTRGEVSLGEIHAALRSHMTDLQANPRAVFDELDEDKSGSLSHEEVRK